MTHKIAKTKDEAWELQEKYESKPHGWIQWKNTDVCMDVHCKCGVVTHIDGEFVYSLECPACNTKYMCNGHIELIEFETLAKKLSNPITGCTITIPIEQQQPSWKYPTFPDDTKWCGGFPPSANGTNEHS